MKDHYTDYSYFEFLAYLQIGGNMKSGTSLLTALLDNHPSLISSGETQNAGVDYSYLSNDHIALNEKIDFICSKRRSKNRNGQSDIFRDISINGRNSFKHLQISYLLSDYISNRRNMNLDSKKYLVDKSPFSHIYANELRDKFQNFKFIHMIRDPRDNYAAAAARYFNVYRNTRKTTTLLWRYKKWCKQSMEYAVYNMASFKNGSYLVIKFEDLVQDSKKSIKSICDYLGIDETESLYLPTRAGSHYAGNNKEGKIFDGISSENVNKWSSRVPNWTSAVIEYHTRKLMKNFNYEPSFSYSFCFLAEIYHQMMCLLFRKNELFFREKYKHILKENVQTKANRGFQ